jgi:zona occludens toxin (predicted ATPase)
MTDFHFVLIGTVKGESKEVALEILKTITNKSEEIKDISELKIFGKTL